MEMQNSSRSIHRSRRMMSLLISVLGDGHIVEEGFGAEEGQALHIGGSDDIQAVEEHGYAGGSFIHSLIEGLVGRRLLRLVEGRRGFLDGADDVRCGEAAAAAVAEVLVGIIHKTALQSGHGPAHGAAEIVTVEVKFPCLFPGAVFGGIQNLQIHRQILMGKDYYLVM